jgi:hypothetical protein
MLQEDRIAAPPDASKNLALPHAQSSSLPAAELAKNRRNQSWAVRVGTLLGWLIGRAAAIRNVPAEPVRNGHVAEPARDGARNGNVPAPVQGKVTEEEYRRWMKRRDAHLARIPRSTRPAGAREEHADVALLEEWLEGNVADERVEEYMARYGSCPRCQVVYDRYKALKAAASH